MILYQEMRFVTLRNNRNSNWFMFMPRTRQIHENRARSVFPQSSGGVIPKQVVR
jgi:hypothetical protein